MATMGSKWSVPSWNSSLPARQVDTNIMTSGAAGRSMIEHVLHGYVAVRVYEPIQGTIEQGECYLTAGPGNGRGDV